MSNYGLVNKRKTKLQFDSKEVKSICIYLKTQGFESSKYHRTDKDKPEQTRIIIIDNPETDSIDLSWKNYHETSYWIMACGWGVDNYQDIEEKAIITVVINDNVVHISWFINDEKTGITRTDTKIIIPLSEVLAIGVNDQEE